MVSKALLKSKKSQPTLEHFSSMVCQCCVASNNGITEDRPERNPYIYIYIYTGSLWQDVVGYEMVK